MEKLNDGEKIFLLVKLKIHKIHPNKIAQKMIFPSKFICPLTAYVPKNSMNNRNQENIDIGKILFIVDFIVEFFDAKRV